MKGDELAWAMLPEGLEGYFDIESFEKSDLRFRIVLVEKNIVPRDLPKECSGKKVINSVLNKVTIDDFPIRGRKGELILRRRSWKFEGVDKLVTRKIDLCEEGTKLEKEFAVFLKELDRE